MAAEIAAMRSKSVVWMTCFWVACEPARGFLGMVVFMLDLRISWACGIGAECDASSAGSVTLSPHTTDNGVEKFHCR
jgi:hypothetical protein